MVKPCSEIIWNNANGANLLCRVGAEGKTVESRIVAFEVLLVIQVEISSRPLAIHIRKNT